jgi:hypothetical protein
MSYGKSSGSSAPAVSAQGYQPSRQSQQQFQSGVAQQQPDLAQQLNQIAGRGSPAIGTMVNQQMAPQGATGPAPQPQQAAPTMMDQYATAMGGQAGMSPQQMYNQYSNAVFGNQPQPQQMQAQQDFFTGTVPQQQPAQQTAVPGATDLYNQYASVISGTPQAAYQPNFGQEISPEQRAQIEAQKSFFGGTNPQDLYNQYSSAIFGRPSEQQAQIDAQRNFFTGTL